VQGLVQWQAFLNTVVRLQASQIIKFIYVLYPRIKKHHATMR